jgi:hypothetical protein
VKDIYVMSGQITLDLGIFEQPVEVAASHSERKNICSIGLFHRFQVPEQKLILFFQHRPRSY